MSSDATGAAQIPPIRRGVLRSPTFSAYGWNTDVAAQLIPPTLVMQGIDDTDIPGGTGNAPAIYHARASVYSCLGHPQGGPPDRPWAGPHSTIKAALIEWITNGTFDGADIGTFVVDASGVARPDRT